MARSANNPVAAEGGRASRSRAPDRAGRQLRVRHAPNGKVTMTMGNSAVWREPSCRGAAQLQAHILDCYGTQRLYCAGNNKAQRSRLQICSIGLRGLPAEAP